MPFLASLSAAVPAGVWLWARRLFLFSAGLAATVLLVSALALRFWFLPEIGRYKDDVARALSQAAGQTITIGDIRGGWEGIHPRLVFLDVTVYDKERRPALTLGRVDNQLSWLSVFTAQLRLSSIFIERPSVHVRRTPEGGIYVAGILVNGPGGNPDFADWVLTQRRIFIHDATLIWEDGLRGAPPVEIKSVHFRLENRWGRHRFGLRGDPPDEVMAGALDIRGDLRGDSVADLSAWKGRLYAQLGRVDVNVLRQWLPVPSELRQGVGAARLWFGFAAEKPTEVTAELQLDGVAVRLQDDLPELRLVALRGQVGWQAVEGGQEFLARHFSLATEDGISIQPMEAVVRFVPHTGSMKGGGSLEMDDLILDPLVRLTAYLPLPDAVRGNLGTFSPSGRFDDFALEWEGDWQEPESYSIRGRFSNLGFRSNGKLPGMSGISGRVEGDEDDGTVWLTSGVSRLDLPGVFRAPIDFTRLDAEVGWKRTGKETRLLIQSAEFANAHLSGSASGEYHAVPGKAGLIDLTGHLDRADARSVHRYIPLVVDEDARAWLDRAFLSGGSKDVRLTLKGDLDHFPFRDGKGGTFRVAAKIEGGTLDYAPGWPRIENLAGDLVFENARMEVNTTQGLIGGYRLGRVKAVIPDLEAPEEWLEVDGEGLGSTQQALNFVNESPVRSKVEGFTDGLKALGEGALKLSLRMPLRHVDDTKVSGSYRFINNRLFSEGDIPTLDRVNAMLEFSEGHVKIDNANLVLWGGPTNLNAASQPDGSVIVTAAGRLTAGGLASAFPLPGASAMSGQADWKAHLTLRRGAVDLIADSTLAGLALRLPAPFTKAAKDSESLRVEKHSGEGRDTLSFTYGNNLLSGQFQRQKGRIVRGLVAYGRPATAPMQDGLWLVGNFPVLDVDAWGRALGGGGEGGKAGGLELAGTAITVGTLFTGGREFHDMKINARTDGHLWHAKVDGREMQGDVTYDSRGKGSVSAQLRRLELKSTSPSAVSTVAEAQADARDFPALDVAVENFAFDERKFGRLELAANFDRGASPSAVDDSWQIRRLRLSGPEYSLEASGEWRGWQRQPRTRLNLNLEANNVGKLLARFGYPDAMANGTARLNGSLFWLGAPQRMDFPSLEGNLELEVNSGRFLKVDPGVGKLLGVLSLQALPRRITLDFRDVFSEGFAFDSISGKVAITHGVASTQDLHMDGPAAKVAMSGQTDLARETQNLRVEVVPQLGDSVSVAGALVGGPVVGLTSLVVQKLLKDPLGQIIAYRYSITGTWADPQVTKLGVETEAVK